MLPQLVFDNTPIRFVDRDKHLVVTLSSIGHIDNIVISLTKILEIMRKLKYSISTNALNQMYMSYLLPIVEMRVLYEMDALNRTHKHYKRFALLQD